MKRSVLSTLMATLFVAGVGLAANAASTAPSAAPAASSSPAAHKQVAQKPAAKRAKTMQVAHHKNHKKSRTGSKRRVQASPAPAAKPSK